MRKAPPSYKLSATYLLYGEALGVVIYVDFFEEAPLRESDGIDVRNPPLFLIGDRMLSFEYYFYFGTELILSV